jgi:chromosome segregation ATPase
MDLKKANRALDERNAEVSRFQKHLSEPEDQNRAVAKERDNIKTKLERATNKLNTLKVQTEIPKDETSKTLDTEDSVDESKVETNAVS